MSGKKQDTKKEKDLSDIIPDKKKTNEFSDSLEKPLRGLEDKRETLNESEEE